MEASALYNDFGSLAALQAQAQTNPDAAVEEVAGQFEALFVQMMIKSMREATVRGGLFSSSQLETYEQMYDQQLALELSQEGGIGLKDILVRQLGGSEGAGEVPGRALAQYRELALRSPLQLEGAAALRDDWDVSTPEEFAARLMPLAQRTARELGTQPEVLLAQAALETGWGRHVSRDALGSSNNFFNIKAGADWDGPTVRVSTLEYHQGLPRREVAEFRAYDTPADSFSDYAALLRESPRYADALARAPEPEAFLAELQRAGYATDPTYAEKVLGILGRDDAPWAGKALKLSPQLPLTTRAPDGAVMSAAAGKAGAAGP